MPLPPFAKQDLNGTGGNIPGLLLLAGLKAAQPEAPIAKAGINPNPEEIAQWIIRLREILQQKME